MGSHAPKALEGPLMQQPMYSGLLLHDKYEPVLAN